MMAQVIARINQTGGMGTAQDVAGLQSVAKYIGKHIAIIAQDKNNKPKVKDYTDALSSMMNFVRAFAQRQQEAQQKQGGQADPETMQKIQGQIAELQAKLKIADAKASQQLRHKELKFRQQLQHKDAQTANDIKTKTGTALAETAINGMRAGATPPKNPLEE
jgi:hypothetical protein